MTFWGSFSSANNLIPQKNKFCKADEIVSKSEIFSREEAEKHEKTGGLDKFNKTQRLPAAPGDFSGLRSKNVFKKGWKDWKILVRKTTTHRNKNKNLNTVYLMFS